MNSESDGHAQTALRILVRVVTPVGTAIWAFTQAPGSPPIVAWALIGLTVVALYYGFNQTIQLADDRFNREAQNV